MDRLLLEDVCSRESTRKEVQVHGAALCRRHGAGDRLQPCIRHAFHNAGHHIASKPVACDSAGLLDLRGPGQHILLPWATQIEQAGGIARDRLTRDVMAGIVECVPDAWLEAIPGAMTAAERRAVYLDFFARRLAAANIFEQEAIHARG